VGNFKLNIERTIIFKENQNLEKLLYENSLDFKKEDIQIKSVNLTENELLGFNSDEK
jgi:hypothetical protein